ncbi:MAG TPA: response regulator transcription factor [Thermodesulfobacteriota bacterium]|nr:response regulator transcription factor [Thermodesulfobacteriota bacterium]
MTKPIRILLADDHNLVRAGIRSLIQNIDGMEVIGEVGDGRNALSFIEAYRPDIALIDISMPGLNGLEVTARATKEFPEVGVIILSMHLNEEYVLQALRSGASGYLVKGADQAELEIAIRAVAGGQTYLSPGVSKHIVADYLQRAEAGGTSLNLLTPRQREILQLIAEGCSTKKIARMLNLSVKTVDTHRTKMMERLDIHDIAGLVRYAIRMGIIKPE